MDVFDLVAKISLDSSEYDKGLSSASDSASRFGDVFKANIASDIVRKGFETAKDGAKKLADGFVGLVKESSSAYADQEQLIGGVQKLYGTAGQTVEQYAESQGKSVDEVKAKYADLTKAQDIVVENSKNAFKTAGMSANEYMETATQFSASLISSLNGDTVKAAEQTDIAMTAISDNVNTFGSNMEDVSNAFKGFSKQNYTMLDNLKLGYGGTKSEMERLIKDANEWGKANGEASDLSIDSFSDVVTAIQQIQEKQQIAGTTAREASSTVSGSIGMAKKAWENLVAGLGDGSADIDQLVGNLVDSIAGYTDESGEHVKGVVDNLLPVIEQSISGIGTLVERLAPIISEKLPGIIDQILPTLVSSVGTLLVGLASTLPTLFQSIIDVLPTVAHDIWEGFKEAMANVEGGDELISVIQDKLFPAFENLGSAIQTVLSPFIDFGDEVSAQTSPIEILTSVIDGLSNVINVVADLLPVIVPLIEGVIAAMAFAKVVSGITSVISSVKTVIGLFTGGPFGLIALMITTAVAAGVLLYQNWDTIEEKADALFDKLEEVFGAIGDFISGVWDGIKSGVSTAWDAITGALSTAWNGIKNTASTVFNGIKDTIGTAWDNIKTAAGTTWDTIKSSLSEKWEGIKSTASETFDKVRSTVGDAWDKIKSKTVEAWENVKQKVEDNGGGIKGILLTYTDAYKQNWEATFNKIDELTGGKLGDALEKVRNKLEDIRGAFQSKMDAAKEIVSGAIEKIKGFFNFEWHLPSLKLPHFSIDGSFSLNPPSVPHFSVDWYKKAMDQPYLFTQPTLIGAGEAGDEVMYGRKNLLDDIRTANAQNIDALLGILQQYLPQIAAKKQVVMDNGIVVGALAPAMNAELARLNGRSAF